MVRFHPNPILIVMIVCGQVKCKYIVDRICDIRTDDKLLRKRENI